jgi:CheY-like chemotaxis protein
MPSVLIIDDESAVRESIKLILGKIGFGVTTAVDGRSGIKKFFDSPTDLVIVDMVMPRSDGLAVIKELRAASAATRILAISGGGNFAVQGYKPGTVMTDAYLELANKWGADAVLSKPFHRQDLMNVLRGLIFH